MVALDAFREFDSCVATEFPIIDRESNSSPAESKVLQPKKITPAYFFFVAQNVKKYIDQDKLSFAEANKKAGVQWSKMSEVEKGPF